LVLSLQFWCYSLSAFMRRVCSSDFQSLARPEYLENHVLTRVLHLRQGELVHLIAELSRRPEEQAKSTGTKRMIRTDYHWRSL
jgi:hypothetical protein